MALLVNLGHLERQISIHKVLCKRIKTGTCPDKTVISTFHTDSNVSLGSTQELQPYRHCAPYLTGDRRAHGNFSIMANQQK